MSLFQPKEGECFKKEDVVSSCLTYIYSSEFGGNVTEKEQKISLIKAKSGKMLEFHSRGKGWGNSALNPNCWISVSVTENSKSNSNSISKTVFDSKAQYNQRPWQGKYRNDVLRIWKACAVTGCKTASLLTASHIKPVIHCTSEEKVDPYNAILLSKIYDKLFDSGLISFEDDGRIVVSENVPKSDLEALGININAHIKLDSRQLPYLNFHREKIFKDKKS